MGLITVSPFVTRLDRAMLNPGLDAKNASGIASDVVPISWQGFTDASNPFSKSVGPGFPGSSCQFPQITAGGIEDSHQHGKDLAQVYRDQLGFLPKELDHDLVSFRVTNNVITSQVLGGLAKGMFKDVGDLAAFIQVSTSVDAMC